MPVHPLLRNFSFQICESMVVSFPPRFKGFQPMVAVTNRPKCGISRLLVASLQLEHSELLPRLVIAGQMLTDVEQEEIESDEPLPGLRNRHRSVRAFRCGVVQAADERNQVIELCLQ